MKDILKYEIKKTLRAKSVIVLCLLLAVFNIVISFFTVPTDNATTQEKYDKLTATVVKTASVNYSQIVDKRSENALYQKDVAERFASFQNSVTVEEVKGFDSLLMSPYPYISALVLCVWVALQTAFGEYSASLVLLEFKSGRKKISYSKIILLALSALLSVPLFCLCFSLGTAFAAGFGGAFAPVQSILAYIRCPYELNVLGAVVLRALFAALTVMLAAMLVYCTALAVRKFIPALICVVAFVGADYLISAATKNIFDVFYNFNFRVFILDFWLERYSGIKIGIFVPQTVFALVITVLGIAALCALAIFIFRKTVCIKSVHNSKERGKKRVREGKSLFAYELKKMFRGKTVIVVLALLVFKVVMLYVQIDVPRNAYDTVYKYYLSQMQDMSYERQVTYVQEEYAEAQEEIEEGHKARELFEKEEIDPDVFTEITQRAGAAEMKASVLFDIQRQLGSVGALRDKGLDAKLIYTTGWDELFSLAPDYIGVIMIAFVIIPYVAMDGESKFSPMLNGMFLARRKEKRKHSVRKGAIMLAFSAAVVLVFSVFDVLLVHKRVGLSSLGEYAVGTLLPQSVQALRLWQILAIKVAFSLLGAILVIATAALIVKLLKNSMILMLAFAVMQFGCILVSRFAGIFFALDYSSYFGFDVFLSPWYAAPIQLAVICALSAAACLIKKKKSKNILSN